MSAKRLFAAIELPDSLKESLVRLEPEIRGARWVPAEQMHLTLGFFGDVDPIIEEKLRDRLTAIQWSAFFLPLIGLGTFPAKGRPKIIWIGVGTGHPHLFQLHKRVQDAAVSVGLEGDLKPWHPHMTLARCRDVSPESVRPFLKANAEFDAGMVHVESFVLHSSKLTPTGPIHTPELIVRA